MSQMEGIEQDQAVQLLLVDDDEVDVMALRRALLARGVANPVHVAEDGLAALELLRGPADTVERPYIVLLDLNMPRMNGIEFLKEVRQDSKLRDAVVFIFSTSDDRKDIKQAYDLNVAGYVVKSRVDASLAPLTNLLERYWQVVELPR